MCKYEMILLLPFFPLFFMFSIAHVPNFCIKVRQPGLLSVAIIALFLTFISCEINKKHCATREKKENARDHCNKILDNFKVDMNRGNTYRIALPRRPPIDVCITRLTSAALSSSLSQPKNAAVSVRALSELATTRQPPE